MSKNKRKVEVSFCRIYILPDAEIEYVNMLLSLAEAVAEMTALITRHNTSIFNSVNFIILIFNYTIQLVASYSKLISVYRG